MSNEILLDKERLISISNDFDSVLEQSVEATQLATEACGGTICLAISRSFNVLVDGIRESIKLIVESFTTTDQEIEKAAKSIVGVDTHNTLSSGGGVVWDMNGNRYEIDKQGKLRRIFDSIDEINPPQQVQIRRCTSAGFNSNEGGICNISSITTLLNRKYAYDHGGEAKDYFTPEDSFKANGCTDIIFHGHKDSGDHSNQDYYQYKGSTNNWSIEKTYSNGSDASYVSHAISKSAAKKQVESNYGGSYEKYVAHLLEEHPEGICIRNSKANHVAVITGYTQDANGNISLQVEDPVGNYKGDLYNTGAWIFKKDPDIKHFWDHLDSSIAFTYVS